MKLWPPLKKSHPWSVLGISSTLEVAAAGWGKLMITSAPMTSHWEAFQMEGEVDNKMAAVIMQRRAIFIFIFKFLVSLLYCCRTDWAGLNIILCSL